MAKSKSGKVATKRTVTTTSTPVKVVDKKFHPSYELNTYESNKYEDNKYEVNIIGGILEDPSTGGGGSTPPLTDYTADAGDLDVTWEAGTGSTFKLKNVTVKSVASGKFELDGDIPTTEVATGGVVSVKIKAKAGHKLTSTTIEVTHA